MTEPEAAGIPEPLKTPDQIKAAIAAGIEALGNLYDPEAQRARLFELMRRESAADLAVADEGPGRRSDEQIRADQEGQIVSGILDGYGELRPEIVGKARIDYRKMIEAERKAREAEAAAAANKATPRQRRPGQRPGGGPSQTGPGGTSGPGKPPTTPR